MPDATLSISEGLSVAMQESLITGRLDIALLYNASLSPDIELTPLLEEPLFLVQRQTGKAQSATRPRPVPLRDVARLPLAAQQTGPGPQFAAARHAHPESAVGTDRPVGAGPAGAALGHRRRPRKAQSGYSR